MSLFKVSAWSMTVALSFLGVIVNVKACSRPLLPDPPNVQPKAAFIYLVHAQRGSSLNRSLALLQSHFLISHPGYQVILYHDSDLQDYQNIIPADMKHARWVLLKDFTRLPKHYSWEYHAVQESWPVGGYSQMIHFWWSKVFEQRDVRELDYYCRMDTDSSFTAPVKHDMFMTMHKHHYLYGYRHRGQDDVDVTDGMWDFVDQYLKDRPNVAATAAMNQLILPLKHERNVTPISIYYNNFEVVDVQAFRSNTGLREFTEAVLRTNYIYNRRWGDAPLRFLSCQLLFNVEKVVKHFCDISYEHQGMLYPATC